MSLVPMPTVAIFVMTTDPGLGNEGLDQRRDFAIQTLQKQMELPGKFD